tara:strand:+ start:1812 stop:2381 length:570 start_codon:yes stop_codon:yes gene_type:complete
MTNKVKNIIFIGFIIGSFVFGLSSGYYKHFPMNTILKIGGKTGVEKLIPWEGRNFHTGVYEKSDITPTSKTGIYLTYGQSNSSNSGKLESRGFENTFMFLRGITYKYKNPSLGGTGYGGSVWGYVGEKLVSKEYHDNVIFSNCGWGGKSIHKLNEGEIFEYLVNSYYDLIEKYGRVDGILFHSVMIFLR